MLLVLLKQEACLLQGWVLLIMRQEETTNDFAHVLHVSPEILLAETEFVTEELVLLLEDSDQSECV